MRASDFLVISRKFSESTHAHEFRTGISRAYYAAFHLIKENFSEYATSPDFNIAMEKHKNVREAVKLSATLKSKNLNKDLKYLWEHRVDADYFLEPAIDKRLRLEQICQDAIDLYSDISDTINEVDIYSVLMEIQTNKSGSLKPFAPPNDS